MNMKFSLFCVAAMMVAGVFAENEASFFTLPLCRRVHGSGEVLCPGGSEWQSIEEGRFYPLGSSYRAASEDGLVVIAFGKESTVTIEKGASFSTCPQKLGEPSRTIVLTGGDVSVSLPTDMKPGLFLVTTSAFTVRDMTGDSKFAYTDKGDGFEADVRCVTGSLGVTGRHYTIPKMQPADVLRIRSSHDDLETILYGKSGDYVVQLDRGQMVVSEVQSDGEVKDTVESSTLEWHLSVATRVQINRAVPAVGERMSVTMMTFDSTGTMKNNFAFAERRPEINTGELVASSVPKEEAVPVEAEAPAPAAEEEATETNDEE